MVIAAVVREKVQAKSTKLAIVLSKVVVAGVVPGIIRVVSDPIVSAAAAATVLNGFPVTLPWGMKVADVPRDRTVRSASNQIGKVVWAIALIPRLPLERTTVVPVAPTPMSSKIVPGVVTTLLNWP